MSGGGCSPRGQSQAGRVSSFLAANKIQYLLSNFTLSSPHSYTLLFLETLELFKDSLNCVLRLGTSKPSIIASLSKDHIPTMLYEPTDNLFSCQAFFQLCRCCCSATKSCLTL